MSCKNTPALSLPLTSAQENGTVAWVPFVNLKASPCLEMRAANQRIRRTFMRHSLIWSAAVCIGLFITAAKTEAQSFNEPFGVRYLAKSNRNFPASAVGRVVVTYFNPNMSGPAAYKQVAGTACMVSPRTAMTAAHVILSPDLVNRGYKRMGASFEPARHGSSTPFPKYQVTKAVRSFEWVSGDLKHDYGLLVFSTDVGRRTGWLDVGVWPRGWTIEGYVVGYDQDYPSANGSYYQKWRRVRANPFWTEPLVIWDGSFEVGQGASGGPLIGYNNSTRRWETYGVFTRAWFLGGGTGYGWVDRWLAVHKGGVMYSAHVQRRIMNSIREHG